MHFFTNVNRHAAFDVLRFLHCTDITGFYMFFTFLKRYPVSLQSTCLYARQHCQHEITTYKPRNYATVAAWKDHVDRSLRTRRRENFNAVP